MKLSGERRLYAGGDRLRALRGRLDEQCDCRSKHSRQMNQFFQSDPTIDVT